MHYSRFSIPALVMLAVLSVGAQATVISIDSQTRWVDTGIDVNAGDLLTIITSGQVIHNDETPTHSFANSDGIGEAQEAVGDPIEILDGTLNGSSLGGGFLVDSAIIAALVGRIDSTLLTEGVVGKGAGFVGSNYNQTALASGRLFLSFNDEDTAATYLDNLGSFTANITVTAATASVPTPATMLLLLTGIIAVAFRKANAVNSRQ